MVQGAQLFMNNFANQTGGGGSPINNRVALAEACDIACDPTAPPKWGAWGGGWRPGARSGPTSGGLRHLQCRRLRCRPRSADHAHDADSA